MTFVPLSPIPLKDRTSMIFLQYGQIDVLDGAFVLIDKTGIRTHIPVGAVACIMLEPGTRVSHAAVHLAATVGTLLVWVGEAGVRVYSSGQPGGARADKLLYQAKLALTEDLRLKVVRKMYELRFREPPPRSPFSGAATGNRGIPRSPNLCITGETIWCEMEWSQIRS